MTTLYNPDFNKYILYVWNANGLIYDTSVTSIWYFISLNYCLLSYLIFQCRTDYYTRVVCWLLSTCLACESLWFCCDAQQTNSKNLWYKSLWKHDTSFFLQYTTNAMSAKNAKKPPHNANCSQLQRDETVNRNDFSMFIMIVQYLEWRLIATARGLPIHRTTFLSVEAFIHVRRIFNTLLTVNNAILFAINFAHVK